MHECGNETTPQARPIHSRRRVSFPLALLLAGGALRPATSGAQIIRGTVVDAATQAPIAGATIELRGIRDRDPMRATSDSGGAFTLNAPRPGAYTIQARHIGFLTATPDTITIARDEPIRVEMRLDARAVPLEPVRVTARGDSAADAERRALGRFGRVISRQDIDARGTQETTELFRLMPGFVIRSVMRGASAELLMRGPAGLCQPATFIDGSYVPVSRGATIDALISPAMIDHVEIYNSVAAAPTPYRLGTCGVLLFSTRRGEATEGGQGISWKRLAIGAGAAVLLVIFALR